jgi:hypothetical protein
LVADDVVIRNEEVVADRADRFGFTASSAQLGVVGGEVGALGADGGPGALGQLVGQPTRTGAGSSRAPAIRGWQSDAEYDALTSVEPRG